MTELGDEEARALKQERQAAQIERYSRVGRDVFPFVKFSAGPPNQPRCAAAADLDGQYLEEPPMLPLAKCDRPRCYCAWRGVTRWELEQKRDE